jgi:hypothetical protein
MRVQSGFLFACALLATLAGIDDASRVHAEVHESLASNSPAQSGSQENNATTLPPTGGPAQAGNQSSGTGPHQRTAVVLRFAVESQPVTDAAALSAQACRQSPGDPFTSATTQPKSLTVDPKILDEIADEMEKRLAKKMIVMVNPDPKDIPVGAFVLSGCITRANGGNSAERLVGMNLGASHLGVHVVVLSRTKDGWDPKDTFDVQVKGGDILPPLGPIGLAAHAARDTRQTLPEDAKKLADKVLKQLAKDMKAHEQAARNTASTSAYVIPPLFTH